MFEEQIFNVIWYNLPQILTNPPQKNKEEPIYKGKITSKEILKK